MVYSIQSDAGFSLKQKDWFVLGVSSGHNGVRKCVDMVIGLVA